ncbi:LPS biosynthesis glycosyltransferase [Azoarcus sp. TTM-91]|uniref:glycosyltransferase family 9 protein n=1 Tax=Azoarcus sp. TTM-91 TaxID=2691581 RepID=UPI00145F4E81|nr:glycosyltransferase family 9 protein [Azoarcus sp. TTM-91]NMG36534.1 LPS biosynthesis glycosyltransferase [Azoarcus sp. TTM-91]
METPLLQRHCPRNILVFRALQLGDMLCAVPALRALRAACGDARISLVGLPWLRAFAARYPRYLDDFIPFPGFPGLPEQTPDIAAIPGFLAELQARRFDLAIQLHGDGRLSNPLVALFDAGRNSGFRPPGETATADGAFLPYPAQGHELRRLLALTAFLGAPAQGEHLEYPLLAAEREELAHSGLAAGLEAGGYLCLHPGARSAARRWPAECFAAVGNALQAATGLPLVITGSDAEAGLAAAVQRGLKAPARNAAAPISAGALAALLAGARLVVCNDTGVAHLCAALRIPSVTLFRASAPERWAALDRDLHRPVWAPPGHHADEGLAAVLREARALLAKPPSAAWR